MKLNEIDQEIFEEIIEGFKNKYGADQSHEILKDIYRLHRSLANKLGISNLPIACIYRLSVREKMDVPVSEGGYSGVPIKEIIRKEDISQSLAYNIFHENRLKRRLKYNV